MQPKPQSLVARQKVLDALYKNKVIPLNDISHLSINPGEFLLLVSENDANIKTYVYSNGAQLKLLNTFKSKTISGFQPKDLKQLYYFNMLEEESFNLIVAFGAAGTGKTTVAIAKALEDYMTQKKKIYLCKPTVMVQSHENNVFGPVPGDINEKYAPYLGSFEIVLNKVLGTSSKHYLEMMRKNKHLEFMPVEFTRGCTFENCTFILDEVQNLSWHELKTVLSRIGENSKIILCGDPNQIDTGFSYEQSGLFKLVTSTAFLYSNFTTQIELTKQYRGKIPDLIYRIDKENK
jgi:PhoH-like ATPase